MNRIGVVARIHGIYWILGALWPLVHIGSYVWFAGPHEELWLVRFRSLLLIVIGIVLLVAASKQRVTPELKGLAIGGAAIMAFVHIFYSLTDQISIAYLLDGVVELVLIGLWVWAGKHGLAHAFFPVEK
ncbi:MAG: hypothetical protein LPK07_12525 [Hymenobacteraceae bacterium]|nr:hypothetical protein [Hymenobacteraceae bacterium]MDX5482497.1 hypothetical protein [Hymenobacteraceae bacterium]